VLCVREARSTRETLCGDERGLSVNDFVQMASVDSGLPERLCYTVSLSLPPPAFCIADGVYLTRFPTDIAQGTAIPRWAFFNVTVSDIFTIWWRACVDIERKVIT